MIAATIGLFMLTLAADPGIRPRPSADQYPASQTDSRNALRIGAEILNETEVRNTFATDLNRGYLVVEIGVYPDRPLDLSGGDFSLRIGSDKFVRPMRAETIASILNGPARHGSPRKGSDTDIVVYPSATIGYESAPGGYYDPRTGRTRNSGWYGGGGVGVGVGGAGGPAGVPGGSGPIDPASRGANRSTMELELAEKALPENEIRQPAAGYLYFPLPEGKINRKVAYELHYQSPADQSARLRILLKTPTRVK